MRKSRWTMVAASALFATSGCIGPFNAWHQMLNWNEHVVENKWGQEGIFFVCSPVYGLFMFGDALIFNSIEWWGGNNPIPPVGMAKKTSKLDATHDVTIEKVADGKLEIQVIENGTIVGSCTVDPANSQGAMLRDADGNALTVQLQSDGGVSLVAAK